MPLRTPLLSPVDLDAEARKFVRDLCVDAPRHARFLNTLSLMEHIGSRKILLTQGGVGAEDTLRHLAEETRHAHFFRRAAERLAGRALGYSEADLAAPASARLYFGRLDAGISRETGAGRLAYLYVTWAVETRAAWLYGLYEEVLHEAKHPLTLRSVIAEEDAHLAAMEEQLKRDDLRYADRAETFARLERRLFDGWWIATRTALGF